MFMGFEEMSMMAAWTFGFCRNCQVWGVRCQEAQEAAEYGIRVAIMQC
jgi:hypothetical protein